MLAHIILATSFVSFSSGVMRNTALSYLHSGQMTWTCGVAGSKMEASSVLVCRESTKIVEYMLGVL